MDLDRTERPSADEYYVTALQIFDCCGAESTGTLRVDTLMDKFAPFVKTNKTEYNYLKSLLDPDQENPEITVSMLAKTLHKYSENQKSKVDLDESFNLRCGQAPQDSDSGISTDGFQLLEELQCELKEKAHLAHQLRSQLDFTDRQHEEAIAALTAERDSLRAHLNMLREENMALGDARRDYEEACDRLGGSERALDEARRDLDCLKRRAKVMQEQVATLENDKLTLQELLTKSKAECHRINEMYAARQSALLEQNEALRAQHADLSVRLQDQEEFGQQIIKEKVLLEMELKDTLNKWNQTQLRMDRSIDVSYTEDQMLTALDTLNADSQFSQENRILDEESFLSALKEDQGRKTNMSLFDEIRLSFCNMSRTTELNRTCEKILDTSFITIGTQTEKCLLCAHVEIVQIKKQPAFTTTGMQTEDYQPYKYVDKVHNNSICITTGTQTLGYRPYRGISNAKNKTKNLTSTNVAIQTEYKPYTFSIKAQIKTRETQTDKIESTNNNHITQCLECERTNKYTAKLERDVTISHRTVAELQSELERYEENLNVLQKFVNEGNERNDVLHKMVKGLEAKIGLLDTACAYQKERLAGFATETCCVPTQTYCDVTSVSTQVEVACSECEKQSALAPRRRIKRFFWDPLKCLFQVFAVICFILAVTVLYGVTRRGQAACVRDPVPWKWLDAHDLMDLLLRIEYVAEVPM